MKKMALKNLLHSHTYVLMEAAVNETLRRKKDVSMHPRLSNALMIYDESGRKALSGIYRGYISVAEHADVPILMCTPTWRANRERLEETGVSKDVNGDAVRFMKDLRKSYVAWSENIMVGGLMGCKNDCYRPEEGLSAEDAKAFHAWQAEKLASAGADFIMAATLPYLPEAIGMAQSLSEMNIPYLISFVINRDGRVMDGSLLDKACDAIDSSCKNPPLGFMVNCAHPSFLTPHRQKKALFNRLIGYQANASSLDHSELDNAETLKMDDIFQWGNLMIELNKKFGVKILGGCCGTGKQHLQYIVDHIDSVE
jgi:S-methylmethionine-dependent homocysteine/selenocysteine methylase